MKIKPLRKDLIRYLSRHGIAQKFTKQAKLFEANPAHPSLGTERLDPKHLNIYSFRIDRKYRAIFLFIDTAEIEVIDINNHYHK